MRPVYSSHSVVVRTVGALPSSGVAWVNCVSAGAACQAGSSSLPSISIGPVLRAAWAVRW